MIRHHKGHKGQPISVSHNDARRDVTALRLRQRLQRLSRRPLTLSRGWGDGASGANGRERPRMADACWRAGGLERAASGHPRGGSGRAGIRSAPAGVGVLCLRGAGGTDGGGTAGLWLATRYIHRGVAHGEGPSGSPCHPASGLSSPVGKVAVACACALVNLCVLRLPCPVRREARLSRTCPRRVGVVALAHTVGGGTGSGS